MFQEVVHERIAEPLSAWFGQQNNKIQGFFFDGAFHLQVSKRKSENGGGQDY